MLQIRKSEDRGFADHGWLQSRHSFSFADYHDPLHTGFGPLLVINEDRVAPGQGFGTHGHRDMEIVSYVLSGALEHKDSLGTGSVLHYGQVQRMSAGTGVRHSEFNGSKDEPVHFLQIWIAPAARGIAPGYEEKHFTAEQKTGRLCLVASNDGRDGSVTVHQDVAVYATIMHAGHALGHPLAPGRLGYVHVVRGSATVNGIALRGGDALKLSDEPSVLLAGDDDASAGRAYAGRAYAGCAEILVFDLPR